MINRSKISEIVVFNFKSFAGKHKIGPFLDFTAVIGPNGGGKSNIMDAVSFVLGVRSIDLRASNLKDLIYRKESEKANEITRDAYVELNFIRPNQTELVFKRTISQSGNSEYFINNSKETSENYQKTLQSLSINVKAKNFLIFQGQVDALAMKSGRELTGLFEKISGSDEYKQEYENSKNEVEVTEDNLKSINAKITFLTGEKKKLKDQKAQAINYEHLINKIKNLQTTYYLLQFSEIERELVKKKEIIELKGKELEALRKTKEKCILELRECNMNLKQTELKLANINDDIINKSHLVLSKKPELSKLQENIKQFEVRIQAKTENLERVVKEIEFETKRFNNLVEEQNVFEEEIQRKQKTLEEDLKVSISDNKKSAYLQLKKEFGIRTFAEKKELERAKKELSTKEINISLISQQLKDKTLEKNKLDIEIFNFEEKIAKKTEEKQKFENLKTNSISSLSTACQENEDLKIKESEYLKKLETLDNKIRDYKVIEVCRQDNEKEKTIVDDMIRHRKGVKGFFRDLISPIQPKYSLAIQASLGGILNYLLVDTVDTAQYVNQKLKDHGIIKEVLVLENIPEVKISESLRHSVSNHGCLLNDVISYDKNYGLEKALNLYVGNKALAENLENANILRQVRGIKLVVTLQGVCIRNGMISSAPSGKNRDKVSQKKIQTEKEANDIRAELVKIQQIIRGENSVVEIRKNIEQYNNYCNSLQTETIILAKQLDSMITKRKELVFGLKNLEQHVSSLNSQAEHSRAIVNTLESSIKGVEDATFKDFCREMGIPSIKSLEGRNLDDENKLQETINMLRKESVKIS